MTLRRLLRTRAVSRALWVAFAVTAGPAGLAWWLTGAWCSPLYWAFAVPAVAVGALGVYRLEPGSGA